MISAAIFDMDGVLIDSMPFWKQAIKETVEDVGSSFTEELWQQTKGKRIDQVVAYWHEKKPWHKYTNKEVERRVIENVIALVRDNGEPKQGAYKVLKEIRSYDKPIAIASSSYTPVIEVVLEKLNIAQFFDVIHSAEKERFGKPHPDVYIHAAEKLNVPAETCIVFEDSVNGMIAAKAAQMTCVGIPDEENKDDPKVQVADMILDSLSQFDEQAWNTVQDITNSQ